MSNMNVVLLSGNITRDAELRHTGSGTALCKFSIANNVYGGKGNDEIVSFFDCVLWGKRGEALNEYLVKGTGVIVKGEARQERWQSSDGSPRSKVVFHIVELEFKGGRNSGGQGGGQRRGGGQRQTADEWDHDVQPGDRQGGDNETMEFEDDIPF